jgi:hypothetical protein
MNSLIHSSADHREAIEKVCQDEELQSLMVAAIKSQEKVTDKFVELALQKGIPITRQDLTGNVSAMFKQQDISDSMSPMEIDISEFNQGASDWLAKNNVKFSDITI